MKKVMIGTMDKKVTVYQDGIKDQTLNPKFNDDLATITELKNSGVNIVDVTTEHAYELSYRLEDVLGHYEKNQLDKEHEEEERRKREEEDQADELLNIVEIGVGLLNLGSALGSDGDGIDFDGFGDFGGGDGGGGGASGDW